ncbi:hypothetical protein H5V45_02265 [Nocardioides sp. KIGAM211]|uniref:Uncharacterized protein n=1 Tax=Nocardioides luti TaxID=2761101 RepID=A0A7X0RF22_9ACTN|nr:hypothetical protein [Nocardioides luti]MBB6626135.1 hypothetical protein [Nocardioides luti]
MIETTDVGPALDARLDGLAPLPPEHYLAAGRRARRTRRRRRAGGALGLVAAGVLVASQLLPLGSGPERAREHRPDVVASGGVVAPRSLSDLRVEAGTGRIDTFSTDEIPSWAQEYGNHGPAAIAPDGRLWIAPEAAVVRSIADPVGAGGAAAGVAHSYAIEVKWQAPARDGAGSPSTSPLEGTDGTFWWAGFQDAGSTATYGSLDDPDRWTSDFALWAENETASVLDQPRFADRLVHFADDTSKVLVAQPGVEIVRQRTDVDTGNREQYARQSVAEVRIDGHTYFVLADGRRSGHAFYEPFEGGVVVRDFADFVRFVAAGTSE